MLTINTNITSLSTQHSLTRANNAVATSIERLSTGYRINHAADDAANLSISTKMSSQISGTQVAEENTQQGINLLQIADGALDQMQNMTQRIRDLSLQSMNGTYSSEERLMMQEEVDKLVAEIYRQKNTAAYNDIKIFGEREKTLEEMIGASDTIGSYPVKQLSEEEAIAQGYSVIKSDADFASILSNPSGKYCLMNDVNFDSIPSWVSADFAGELNGNGFAMHNYSGTTSIFKTISGTVKNLSIENINVNSTEDYVGGLCKNLTGTLDNCYVSGNLKARSYVGGLLGQNNSGTMRNCSSDVDVIATGQHTGGLIGYNFGSLTNCTATGDVQGTTCVGGLIGHSMNSGAIKACYATGNVTGATNCGGFIGNAYGKIESSYSKGTVTTSGTTTGGFVAVNYADIKNCYSDSNVISTGSQNVGGFVGASYEGSINGCYATGDVQSNANYTGGFAGSGLDISNCYQSGTVSSAIPGRAKVFYGAGSCENCYANGDQPAGVVTSQTGVTLQEPEWFENTYNLTFLGDAYNYEYGRPLLKDNMEQAFKPIQFQVGANSGKDNVIDVETGFSLNHYSADVKTIERANTTLIKTDDLLNLLSEQRANIGAQTNIFEGVLSSLDTRETNLSASNSAIIDADFAKETAELTKNQILQNFTSSLLTQTNTTQELALSLLAD